MYYVEKYAGSAVDFRHRFEGYVDPEQELVRTEVEAGLFQIPGRKGWVNIQEFVSSTIGRCIILDQVMDGRMDCEQCEEGNERCDIC